MRIGTVTSNWNGERFIGAHLEMLRPFADEMLVLQGSGPRPRQDPATILSDIPDSSEAIVRRFFPDVRIEKAVIDEHRAELWNQGLELLSGCDMVLRLDTDMFLTRKDMLRLVSFLKDGGHDRCKLDFARCTTNYYVDFDHGLTDADEHDAMAVSTKGRFSGILDYPASRPYEIAWEGFMVHHFRGWRNGNVYPEFIKKPFDWIRCPQEIRDMLMKEYRP